jgi:LmbE family N-acetylglucosaminyl deacetylase
VRDEDVRSSGPRIVVVSAHLDDAVLSCYHALGPGTIVVTVFAGIPTATEPGWWDRANGVIDSRARMRERQREDEEALALSGSAFVHLDLLDSQYATLPRTAEIAARLAPHVAPATRVLAPVGIRNVDHKAVRDAVLALRDDAILYADLPYALRPDFGGFEPPPEVGRHRTPVEHILSEGAVAEKLAAVSRYRTQLEQLAAPFGDFLNPAGLGREVTWPSLGGEGLPH